MVLWITLTLGILAISLSLAWVHQPEETQPVLGKLLPAYSLASGP